MTAFSLFTLATAILLTISLSVYAEDDTAIQDFKAVDSAFQRHNNIPYTGNPDIDFRKKLIARRENIIDMSEVASAHATDPQTEKLAQETIARQKQDIAKLKQWLATHPQ